MGDLFDELPFVTVHTYKDRAEWLENRHRLKGVGGSDAGTVAGKNPYKTAHDLWEEKTGRREPPDLDSNESVQFGARAEEYIRALWTLENRGRYEMHYRPFTILQNNAEKGLLYSPDGLLKEVGTNRIGIWECKTTTIRNGNQRRLWRDGIPETYMAQVLHGANVLPVADFVILTAYIRYHSDERAVRDYYIDLRDFLEEREELKTQVLQFYYRNLNEDIEPARLLPAI